MSKELTAQVLAADQAWEDAIMQVDTAALNELAHDDLVYTHAAGWAEGKAGFIDHIVNGALRFTSVGYDAVDISIHGCVGVLTSALHLETLDRSEAKGELHFRVTHVWVLEDGRWRLLANQSTRLRAD